MFYMLYEHKKIFQNRLQFIQKLYGINFAELINIYNGIAEKAKHLLNTFLKYFTNNNLEKKEELSKNMICIIDSIVEDERMVLNTFLEELPRI